MVVRIIGHTTVKMHFFSFPDEVVVRDNCVIDELVFSMHLSFGLNEFPFINQILHEMTETIK